MKTCTAHALPLALLLACAATLTACGRDDTPANASGDAATAPAEDGFVTRTTRRALESARKELTEDNVSVGGSGSGGFNINGIRVGGSGNRTAGLPKAQISPAGDFLIEGKAVGIDAAQRDLLLAHRANIIAIAEASITIGIRGAQLGAEAAKGAIASALSGQSAEFEKRMEAEGAKIEAEADRICDRLPPLLASQQALAAELPAFQPYATMDASDVEDCRKDTVVHRNDEAAQADAAAEPASN